MAQLILVLGTGTSVGKTYVAERLLLAFRRRGDRAVGYKPIETGIDGQAGTDIERLAAGSTFHVKPPLATQTFVEPVSPHLASRHEGREIDVGLIRSEVARACASSADVIVLELPGGAFSPLTQTLSVAEFSKSLPVQHAILVAPDRLGVLHDIRATALACAAIGVALSCLVLSAPETPDVSTGQNFLELPTVTACPALGTFPRVPAGAPLFADDPAVRLAAHLVPRP